MPSPTAPAIPYCGPAPLPQGWMQDWNLDPMVILPLLMLAAWGVLRREGRIVAAAGVLALAFVSPLCALSTALFSARVLHHILLIAVAAPLIAAALPQRTGRAPQAAFLIHAAVLWFWHAPGPYAWALASVPGYWLMEATLALAAVWLWQVALRTAPGAGIALLAGTTMQMGLLGALLVFAGRPLFAPHLTTTEPFGLSALEDQQLAGLLMWVPAALPYLAVALWRLRGVLERRAQA